jgi:hypothetical protein
MIVLSRIAFPINIFEVHWLASLVDFSQKRIYIMDSALPSGPNPRQSFVNLIFEVMRNVWCIMVDMSKARTHTQV